MKPCFLRLCVTALAVAGFLAASPRASADTVSSLNLTLTGGGNGYNGGGPFHWSQSTPINTAFGGTVTTYCLDVQDSIKSGKFTTHTDLTKAPTIGNNPNKVTAINTLFDHFYSSSFADSVHSAAFQLALWDLLYGASNPTLTNYLAQFPSGNEKGNSPAVLSLATSMLNGSAWNGVEHDLANSSLVVLVDCTGTAPGTSGRNQDQIMVVKNVPAPPAVMLAGIGVLALFGRSRWTRRTPAAA